MCRRENLSYDPLHTHTHSPPRTTLSMGAGKQPAWGTPLRVWEPRHPLEGVGGSSRRLAAPLDTLRGLMAQGKAPPPATCPSLTPAVALAWPTGLGNQLLQLVSQALGRGMRRGAPSTVPLLLLCYRCRPSTLSSRFAAVCRFSSACEQGGGHGEHLP